jgi:hypothetical protein
MEDVKYPVIAIAFLSALIAFSSGCSSRPNDDTISKDIQKKVASDPETKDATVNVAAKDGKVTFSGKVKTPAAQQKLEQIAREEPGAVGADDQTMVQPEAPPAPTPDTTAAMPPPEQTNPMPAKAVEEKAAPPEEKPKPQPIVVPAGTVLTVRTTDALSSKASQPGQTFLATLAQPVSVHGKPALPAGATVSGRVVSAKAKGRIKGGGELAIALVSVSVRGRTYPLQSDVLDTTVKGKGKRTAANAGGVAAGGALIGGLAGGGKGAGIGALAGAGAGFVAGALTGNKQIEIPAESVLSFTLAGPLTLPLRKP